MNSYLLRKSNLAIREKRPFFPPEKICDVFSTYDLLEIGFLSQRCSRDQQGACIMCDYGVAQSVYSVEEYIREMCRILNSVVRPVETLLLCTNGSFLDDRQIESGLFQAILEKAAQSQMPIVELETHYQDVTVEKLTLMKDLLLGKTVIVEMGLETIKPRYHETIIMKDVDLVAYERIITLIQSFGFQVDTNIMVGLPFLSPQEQFEDCLETIQWSFAHGCRPVLFPVNIKPYTILMEAYHAGFYQPISQWMLPLILETLPEKWLGDITVAWYGNREEIYDANEERVTFPMACPTCSAVVRHFYEDFLSITGGQKRKILLNRLLASVSCKCLKNARQEIAQKSDYMFEARYADFLSWLAKQDFDSKGDDE